MPVQEPNPNDPIVLVVRCSRCGDTFPMHLGEDPICPSCRGDEVDTASEPLL